MQATLSLANRRPPRATSTDFVVSSTPRPTSARANNPGSRARGAGSLQEAARDQRCARFRGPVDAIRADPERHSGRDVVGAIINEHDVRVNEEREVASIKLGVWFLRADLERHALHA